MVADGYFKFVAQIEYQYPESSAPSDYAEMRYRDRSGPIDVEAKVRVDLSLALGTELGVSRCPNIVVNSGKAIQGLRPFVESCPVRRRNPHSARWF